MEYISGMIFAAIFLLIATSMFYFPDNREARRCVDQWLKINKMRLFQEINSIKVFYNFDCKNVIFLCGCSDDKIFDVTLQIGTSCRGLFFPVFCISMKPLSIIMKNISYPILIKSENGMRSFLDIDEADKYINIEHDTTIFDNIGNELFSKQVKESSINLFDNIKENCLLRIVRPLNLTQIKQISKCSDPPDCIKVKSSGQRGMKRLVKPAFRRKRNTAILSVSKANMRMKRQGCTTTTTATMILSWGGI